MIGCLIELIRIPRSKFNTSTPNINLLTFLVKGNFTRDEWNHLLNLCYIRHFSSAACTAALAKRAQQGSGEERVTVKSRPMMNLVARTASIVSTLTSVSPVRRYYGKQDPWKFVVAEDRSGQPDKASWRMIQQVHPHHEAILLDGTAQSVRNEEALRDRSGRPEYQFSRSDKTSNFRHGKR